MKNGIKKDISPRSFIARNSGFTLIELLIVITIIGILSGASFAVLNKFNGSQNLNIASENIKNELNFAKSNALSQVLKKCTTGRFDGYSFHYDQDRNEYWVEEECTPAVANNIVGGVKKKLPDKVTFQGSGEILFEPLEGGADLSSARVIVIQNESGSRSKPVTVYKSGVIE